MFTQVIGELLQRHKKDLVKQVTTSVIDKIPETTNVQIQKIVLGAIEALETYFFTDDVTTYQQFFQDYSQQLFEQSNPANVQTFQLVSEAITATINALVERELAGPENENIRNLYYRKMRGLLTLANVSAVNAHITTRAKPKRISKA